MPNVTTHALKRFQQRSVTGEEADRPQVASTWQRGLELPTWLANFVLCRATARSEGRRFYRWVPTEGVVFVWDVHHHDPVLITVLQLTRGQVVALKRHLDVKTECPCTRIRARGRTGGSRTRGATPPPRHAPAMR